MAEKEIKKDECQLVDMEMEEKKKAGIFY